jgi:cell division septation protein DedD
LPLIGKKEAKQTPMAEAIDPGLKIAVDVVMARLRGAEDRDFRAVTGAAPEIYQLAAALMPPANGLMQSADASYNVRPAQPNTLGDLQRMGERRKTAARTLGAVVNGAKVYKASYNARGGQTITPPPALPEARSLMHAVHLGSYRSAERALDGYNEIRAKAPLAMAALQPRVERVDLGPKKGIYERLKAGPFASRAEAQSLCAQLRTTGQYCVPADYTGRTPG